MTTAPVNPISLPAAAAAAATDANRAVWYDASLLPLTHPVAAVCQTLHSLGAGDVAERLAYLASAADLAEGDVPATVDSAYAFLDFFVRAQSAAGVLNLTCSPDGWLCAEWDFADGRSVCLWFLDDARVMFVAQDCNGDFVAIDGDNEIGSRREITDKLIQAGFLEWKTPDAASANSYRNTILPGIAAPEPSEPMADYHAPHFS